MGSRVGLVDSLRCFFPLKEIISLASVVVCGLDEIMAYSPVVNVYQSLPYIPPITAEKALSRLLLAEFHANFGIYVSLV